MDDDSSYLDEASSAPSIPEGLPGDKSNRVLITRFLQFPVKFLFIASWFVMLSLFMGIPSFSFRMVSW